MPLWFWWGTRGTAEASAKAVKAVPENSELDYEVVQDFYLMSSDYDKFCGNRLKLLEGSQIII